MLKLDKKRPYAVLFDGDRQMQFHYQDGKMFNMSTDDEVDLTSIAVKAKPAITCRFCNAKRETAEMMHEHLIAKHGAQMEAAKVDKPKEEAEKSIAILTAKPETSTEEKPETETVEEKAEDETKPETKTGEEKDKPKVETEGKAEPETETVVEPVNPEVPLEEKPEEKKIITPKSKGKLGRPKKEKA